MLKLIPYQNRVQIGCSAQRRFAQVQILRAESRYGPVVMSKRDSEAAVVGPALQLAERQRSLSGRGSANRRYGFSHRRFQV